MGPDVKALCRNCVRGQMQRYRELDKTAVLCKLQRLIMLFNLIISTLLSAEA